MLATIVLVGCLAAGCVVAAILFILYGPVPVRRKVQMVSRIQAPLPMAAAPVLFGAPVVGTPAIPPPQPQPAADLFGAEPVTFTAVEPPPVPKKAAPPIAPLTLRRPRTAPSPLPRTRSARGTENRVIRDEDARTEQVPLFEADDVTHVDDAR